MNRKTRTTITKSLIMQVKSNIQDGKSLVEIGRTLLISYSTVRLIAKRLASIPDYVESHQNAYERRERIPRDSRVNQLVSEILTSENETTQKEVVAELAELEIQKSQPTISRIVKKINFTRKRLTLVPIERNTPQLIELRRAYGRSIEIISNENLIFLDEAGFSKHTSRNYGYSPIGSKAVKFVRAGRGQNISLLSMITLRGTLAYKVHQGPINAQILHDFLSENLETTPIGVPQKVLVLDNVKFHHSAIIKSLCAEKRVLIKYLPAYSPHLNPIEEYFSIVKSRYSGIRSVKNTLNQIKECIDIAIFDIQLNIYQNLFINMRKWVDKALAGELFL